MSTSLETINNSSSSNAPAIITASNETNRAGSTAISAAVAQGASECSSEQFQEEKKVQRRILRPRTKPKSYAEPPDIVLKQSQLIAPVSLALPAHSSKRRSSGGTPMSIINHITADTPTSTIIGQSALKMSPPHFMLPGGATLTVCSSQPTPNQQHHHSQQQQQDDHCESVLQSLSYLSDLTITPSVTITPKSAPPSTAGAHDHLKAHNPNIVSDSHSSVPTANDTTVLNNSVSIAPVPPLPQQGTDQQKQQYNYLKNERNTPGEEQQIPLQSQAAARMALCKQIEKTLLHVLPPKPPPPEMHFIPNPNNVEFVCLLGLETAVDYIQSRRRSGSTVTNMAKITPPFQCAQCTIDFTPAWKFVQQAIGTKDTKVICEQCANANESQQKYDKYSGEQAGAASNSSQLGLNMTSLSALANVSPATAAATLQAFQKQLVRVVEQNLSANPQYKMQYYILLYSYEKMVQAAQASAFKRNNTTSPSTSSATNNQTGNWWDIQRAAELLRQNLLDIVPQPPDGQSSTRIGQGNCNI